MDDTSKKQRVSEVVVKKMISHTRFFRHFGHDARHDWMFLLCLSTVLVIGLVIFAAWTFIKVQSGKAFSFETEIVSVPSITVSTDALNQVIEVFEKKRIKFNSIRQTGVNTYDPSL